MDLQLALGAHGVFWLFAAILVVSVVFVFFLVPETRGKTLEDIERLYTNEVRSDPASRVASTYRVSSMANLKPTPSIIL